MILSENIARTEYRAHGLSRGQDIAHPVSDLRDGGAASAGRAHGKVIDIVANELVGGLGCPGTTAPWRWTWSLFKRRFLELSRTHRSTNASSAIWCGLPRNCAHTGTSVALKEHAQGITTMKSVSWPVSRLR